MRTALLLLLAAPLLAADLAPGQEAELKALRTSLWDQGYSEADIEARVEARRKELLSAKPAEDPELAKLKAQLRGLGERGILPKAAAEKYSAQLEEEWARAHPLGRLKLRLEYRRKMRENVRAWWKQGLVREGRSPQDAESFVAMKEGEIKKESIRLLKQGTPLEEIPRLLMERFPEVPSEVFDLAEPEGAPEPAPPEPALSDDDIDLIVDELLRELEEPPPER